MNPQTYSLFNNTQNSYGGLLNGNPAVGNAISQFQNLAPKYTFPLSTPATIPGKAAVPTIAGTNGAPMSPANVMSTPTGGYSFPKPPVAPAKTAATTPTNTNTFQTPNGGSLALDASGNVSSFTPAASYTIDTSGAVPSSALGSSLTMQDLTNKRNQYQDYVQGLYNATQISPEYQAALEGVNNANLRGAELKSNYYTGGAPGDTLAAAQAFTTREGALNDISGLRANQALAVQQAIRTGNIEAYKALVGASAPQTVSPGSSLVSPYSGDVTYGGSGAYSDYQAQQTYFNLAQQFPDATIPAYNPQLSAQQNLQNAQQLAAGAPSFQSRNLVQVQLPGGGISFVNKNQIVTGANGQTSIISPAAASQAAAASAAIKDLTTQSANVQSAITTADSNFPLLLQVVKKAGINDYNSPLANQLQQAFNNKLIGSGDIASFNSLKASLQATYSQILARGYAPTESVRKEADAIVNGNIGYNALASLYNTLRAESGNVMKGYQSTISQYNNQLQTIYNSGGSTPTGSTNTPTTSGGYINPSQASW